jgi:hypothetical protein
MGSQPRRTPSSSSNAFAKSDHAADEIAGVIAIGLTPPGNVPVQSMNKTG